MTKAARKKVARQSTAAFAASQPLFAALYNASNTLIGIQKANLTMARDLVQGLHVKLPDTESHGETIKHERYVNNIVAAFQSAAATYTLIFQKLVAITAPDPSEGKEAMKHHEHFQAMLKVAMEAKVIATEFQRVEDAKRESMPDAKATGNPKLPSRKRRVADEDNSPEQAISSPQQERKPAKKARIESGPSVTEQPSIVPETETQYEDISAEVEARLKAKEEKKRAKEAEKALKKRKRDSAGSELKAEEPALEITSTEKPKKKKIKKIDPEAAENGVAPDAVSAENAEKKMPRKPEVGEERTDSAMADATSAPKKEKRSKDAGINGGLEAAGERSSKKRRKSKEP